MITSTLSFFFFFYSCIQTHKHTHASELWYNMLTKLCVIFPILLHMVLSSTLFYTNLCTFVFPKATVLTIIHFHQTLETINIFILFMPCTINNPYPYNYYFFYSHFLSINIPKKMFIGTDHYFGFGPHLWNILLYSYWTLGTSIWSLLFVAMPLGYFSFFEVVHYSSSTCNLSFNVCTLINA